jgi:PadR family transcriptional regulator, regulatory protein AphA
VVNSRLSTTSHAILGLLRLQPWTTYELAKQVQRSLGWFWPRAERKLYDEPKRLVAQGLATSEREMTGARPRTTYAVTDEGRAALRDWLDEPPAPPTLEFEGMLKVFFADGGDLGQLRATLTLIAETAEGRLEEIRPKIEEFERGDAPFPERAHLNTIGLRFVLDHERAIASWARWAHEQTATWTSTTDPGPWHHAHVFASRPTPGSRGRADRFPIV